MQEKEELSLLISRETDYALRIFRMLSNGNKISSIEICGQEAIPQQFAYKILGKLSRAGLIETTRGPEGGSRLMADLHNITLYDLIEILETNNFVAACMNPNYQCNWRKQNQIPCKVHQQLDKIQTAINSELRNHSLHDILFGE